MHYRSIGIIYLKAGAPYIYITAIVGDNCTPSVSDLEVVLDKV
jgi:hypothetical protein